MVVVYSNFLNIPKITVFNPVVYWVTLRFSEDFAGAFADTFHSENKMKARTVAMPATNV